MPVLTPPPEAPAAELKTIDHCLAGIRRRIYALRLTERLVIALAWGAAAGVCLTGARLLHEGALRLDITQPGFGWCALLLALVPLAMALWAAREGLLLRKKTVNGVTTITPALAFTAAGITAACALAGVVLLFVHAGGTIPIWAVPAVPVVLLLAVAGGSVRMIDPRAAAIFVDLQVGLHERVSTALEMLHTPAQSSFEKSFRTPVITSAVAACQQVAAALQSRSSRIRFHRLDQRAYAAAALAAFAAVGVTLLNPLPVQAKAAHHISVVTINQAKQLEKVMQELEKNKPPTDKTDQHLQPLKDAIVRLQDGTMSDVEKTAVLSEAKEKMKQDEDAMKAADKVQDMLKAMEQTQDLAKAADDMKKSEMAKQSGEANAGAQAQAGNEMKQAADNMANKVAGGNADERKKAADQLQAAADKAGADPQLQKSLQNAASAAAVGDSQKLSQNLQDAGQRMSEQSASAQSSGDSVKQAMSEIDRMQDQAGGQSTMGDNNSGGGESGQNGGQQPNGGNGQQSAQGNGSGEQQPGNSSQQSGGQGSQGQSASAGGNKPGGSSEQSGNGSTMMEQRGGPGGTQGPLGGVGSFVRIYDEQSTRNNGSTEKIGSKINPLGGPANGSIDVMGPADKNDPAFKTFNEAMPDNHQRAMDELSREDIPPQYQDMVKDFYEDKK